MNGNHCNPLPAIAMALLLAGCSQASEAPGETAWPSIDQAPAPAAADAPAAPLPRPCSLVTADDAQAVIGSEVGEMANDQDVCMWAGGDSPGSITTLMVQLMRADTVEETTLLFDNLTGLSGNLGMTVNDQMGKPTRKSGQDIEALGDAAWCSATNADLVGTQQLIVRSGTTILSLNVTGMTQGGRPTSLCPKLEVAGRQAFARLGGAP
jgi:hypothetical protein